MPKEPVWLPSDEILSCEEVNHVVSLLAKMGVERVRLTGGEPLVRPDIEKLVQGLARIPGIQTVSMTTNGSLLAEKAEALRRAGLKGVTISLHSLIPKKFSAITGGGSIEHVLTGIDAARRSGLRPLKINSLIIRGYNDDEIIDLASLAIHQDVQVRFIEYMPFDGQAQWSLDTVVSGAEIVQKIKMQYDLIPLQREDGSTVRRYRFADGQGEVDVITSMTNPFCFDCERMRLSADGRIVPCLFDKSEYDLKPALRGGASDVFLSSMIRRAVLNKALGVAALLAKHRQLEHVRAMHTIGG
jgi:cyclic pyranopterin phosphate synthase